MKRYLFLALILLTSCNIGGSTQITDITGTDGLIVIVNVPKDTTIYAGQGFNIPITLENAGASEIENAIISLSGYEKDIVHLTSSPVMQGINLAGKTALIPTGEKTSKVFTVSSVTPQETEKQQTFDLAACYQYQTYASPVVCINPGFASGNIQTGTCSFTTAKQSPTQGAPIAVTKVEVHTFEDKVTFDVWISDVSKKGELIQKDSYSKGCLGQKTTKTESDIVNIEAFLGGQKIVCRDAVTGQETSFFKINEKAASVQCETSIDPEQGAFTTPLSIKLTYGYVQRQSFTVTLKKQPSASE